MHTETLKSIPDQSLRTMPTIVAYTLHRLRSDDGPVLSDPAVARYQYR